MPPGESKCLFIENRLRDNYCISNISYDYECVWNGNSPCSPVFILSPSLSMNPPVNKVICWPLDGRCQEVCDAQSRLALCSVIRCLHQPIWSGSRERDMVLYLFFLPLSSFIFQKKKKWNKFFVRSLLYLGTKVCLIDCQVTVSLIGFPMGWFFFNRFTSRPFPVKSSNPSRGTIF